MKFSRKLTHAVVALACIGMVVPPAAFAAPQAAVAVQKSRDVALQSSGALTGAVLSANAKPVDGAQVVLTQNGKPVAQVISKKDGTFSMPAVKAGVYEIAVGEAKAPIRVWKSETAPAHAARKMALAAEGVIRAQDGEYYGDPNGGVFGGLDIITLWTVTAATGALVLGAINQSDLNDINDKLDQIVSP
ncbi:MAG: carboxypeptidase regulatory-like domain-containing protein [Planctomycetota bacterium]|nr:MAG: carboxypeptidase regulatory-like domain-containing protein [Planctomycetota bacterium]